MAKILVLYHSNSGRTANMAKLIADGANKISNMEIRLKSIDDANEADILWCDGIAVGSPTNLGAVSWKMKKFWDDISRNLWGKVDGKIACVFSSSGSYGGGSEIACLNMLSIMINYGFLVFGVTDYTGPKFSPHYGAISAGEPDDIFEKEACLRLGERLAQWLAHYVDNKIELHPMFKYQRTGNSK